MKRPDDFRAFRPSDAPSQSPIVNELSGYMELGMHRKAASLARKVLKRPKLAHPEFSEAVDVLLSADSRLPECRRLVEHAYEALRATDRRRVRFSMLSFYCSVADYASALPFATMRPLSVADLVLSLDTFVKLQRDDEAMCLAKKGRRWVSRCEDSFDQGCILSALASFFARRGMYTAARTLWNVVPDEVALGLNKFESLAKLVAAEGLKMVRDGMLELERLQEQGDSQLEMSYPGLHEKLVREVRSELKAYEKSLELILPKEEQKDFGLADE